MLDGQNEGFKFFSYGIVVEDKARNSPYIKVVPIDLMSLVEGKAETFTAKSTSGKKANVTRRQDNSNSTLDKHSVSYDVSLPDHKQVSRTEKLVGGSSLVAQWTAIGQSNRITAPDVIKGETVQIYSVYDTDEYFWITMRTEPDIRRQETVTYMYGNRPSGNTPFDRDSAYWVEVSTHDKYVRVHTSNNDGEQAAWDLTIDTRQGLLSFTDNAGNDLTIDSAAGTIVGNAVTSITLKAPDITFDGNVHNTKDVDTTGSTATGGNSSTGGSASIGAGMSIGAGGAGGDIQLVGNINLQGSITGTGNLSMSGTVSGSNI